MMGPWRCGKLLGYLLALVVAAPTAQGVSWKLSSAVQAPAELQAWTGYPPDHPDCTAPGVCQAYETTIPGNTLWYWCGWSTKERTQYWVTSGGPNITVVMMRASELHDCALRNLAGIKSCVQLDNTLCDTKTKCQKRVLGMAFVDASCILVANNDKTAAPVTIQVWQYFDSARLYGTIFSTLLFILILGAVMGQVVYTCVHQWRKPNHRLDELEKLTRAKLAAQAAAVAQQGGAPADAGLERLSPAPAAVPASVGVTVAGGSTGTRGLLDTVKHALGGRKGGHAH